MITRTRLAAADSIASPALTRATHHAATALFRWRRVEVVTQGPMAMPDGPVIYAMNHTHEHDFLPLRWLLLGHEQQLVTWIKPRAYAGLTGAFLSRTGNVPLCSRGYLIAADFLRLHDRRPTEEEYRALRDHVDAGVPLPATLPLAAITTRARDMLGWAFDPERASYRDTVHAAFAGMMDETLRLARRAVARGHHMHIYPQGTVSPQLGPGRSGVIQAALALDLPIVPVGASGIPDALDGRRGPRRRITLRFGKAFRVPRVAFAPGFTPFRAVDEASHRAVLDAQVAGLMDRIEALVDAPHRRPAATTPAAAGRRIGAARFVD